MKKFEFIANGDSAITVTFHEEPSELLSRKLIHLSSKIKSEFAANISDLIPAYQTLTICFKSPEFIEPELRSKLELLITLELDTASKEQPSRRPTIEIPVCYDDEFALDMKEAELLTGLTKQAIIERHTQPEYFVNMLGFLPGFFYLSGLDRSLYMPRKTFPRTAIPVGAVGIGGSQTGVYPVASPGGWQIIGKTPLSAFSPQRSSPFLVRPLDKIKFVSIDRETFNRIQSEQQEKR